MLRSIEIPRHGGDTLFADMVTAYEGLDDDLKVISEISMDDLIAGWEAR